MIQTFQKAPPPFKGTEIHTLPNGLRLILKEDHTVPVVSIQVWARCGAVNELPAVYGISHGLEHMVFKGTPTRSAGEITQVIESHGGAMNAATQLETTHYYIDIPSYGAEPALDVLADTILNPSFPQDELERERLVILEEIHGRDDSPDATLWDEFASTVFEGTPYAIKVIGSKETVSALSQKDLHTYFHSFYTPSNKCVVIAGDFDKASMIDQLTGLFGGQAAGTAPTSPTVTLNGGTPRKATFKKPIQLCHFAMGLPTVGLADKDVVALDLFADVICGGASSRLYQYLREDRQLVLSLACDYTPFSQAGLFSFFGESLPAKADEAIEEVKKQLAEVAQEPIRPEEMKRAKARIKSEWLHGSETPRGQASTLGSLAILGAEELVETYLADIDRLTPDDMRSVYERRIAGRDFHVTCLMPES